MARRGSASSFGAATRRSDSRCPRLSILCARSRPHPLEVERSDAHFAFRARKCPESAEKVLGVAQVAFHSKLITVAHVGEYSADSPIGVNRTIYGLVQRLPMHGVRPEVWHLSSRHKQITQRTAGDVRIYEIPSRPRPFDAILRLPSETRRFAISRAPSVDVVHVHSVFVPDNIWLASAVGRPYVLTPHGGYSQRVLRGRHTWLKSIWMRSYEYRYVSRAAKVHAVSPGELEELKFTFRNLPLEYVPNAVDPLISDSGPYESPRANRFLFIGRMAVNHKGLDVLFEAFARFISKVSEPAELVLAGPDFRGGRKRLESQASDLGIADRVEFREPVYGDEKVALLRESYAFVHPSRWEGLPFAVIEAMSAGCPVLITPETNLGSEVTEYGAGVVVSGDPKGIESGLRELRDSPVHVYNQMQLGAAKLVRERYSWPPVVARLADIYKQIAGHD